MLSLKSPWFAALDLDNLDRALQLADEIEPYTGGFKVGLQLYHSAGPAAVLKLRQKNLPVFLDLKLHDIPNTVGETVRVLVRQGASILNVHAAGGSEMMEAAAAAARDEAARIGVERPLVVAVTVLTSIDQNTFSRDLGLHGAISERVVAWASLARDAGLDGVVASPLEVGAVRKACGPDFVVITPGVRPAGAGAGDQKRTMAPLQALKQGATFLVVGRPVTAALDPAGAARTIYKELTWATP